MEEEIWDELGDLGQALFGKANATAADSQAAGDAFFDDDEFFKADAIHDEDSCKWILHYRIAYLRIRAWDLLLFVPSIVLLSYLLLNLQSARYRYTKTQVHRANMSRRILRFQYTLTASTNSGF
jgi:hypothetical protein